LRVNLGLLLRKEEKADCCVEIPQSLMLFEGLIEARRGNLNRLISSKDIVILKVWMDYEKEGSQGF
jgi:recombinational DNA repair ATPase RecF